ncbi:AP-4 complex subunit sigma-1 isoform X3 [Magallana gigas]|uniref:AP-4 complex subunit sigma-1 isoform X3 n=1 Tax=Magallana gigas TaxID=29159 RepID=UPI00333E76FF
MIHFLMVAGKQGKPRIGRFFTHQKEQISTQTAVIKLCLRDGKENELAMFELFQNLVETLKTYLGKVTEVDIIFNMDRVYMIIDEMIIDGQIAETCSSRILVPLQLMDAAK